MSGRLANYPWPVNFYYGKFAKHSEDPPRKFVSKKQRKEVLNRQVKPAADVARILDEAQVPNLLWGTMAAWLVGDWRPYNEVSEPLCLVLRSKSNSLGYSILGS